MAQLRERDSVEAESSVTIEHLAVPVFLERMHTLDPIVLQLCFIFHK